MDANQLDIHYYFDIRTACKIKILDYHPVNIQILRLYYFLFNEIYNIIIIRCINGLPLLPTITFSSYGITIGKYVSNVFPLVY
jgi:hypothetical protein